MELVAGDAQTLAAAGLAATALSGLLWYIAKRRRARPEARLKSAAREMLTAILVPDGDDGQVHIDYALLTHEAIVLAEVRQVEGHVFGSNAMQDWTVISPRRRFTFSNPQPGMYDRVAAVQRLLPQAAVRGVVLFADGADFSKGLPSHVMLVDDFVAELEQGRQTEPPVALRDSWSQLRQEAVSAQVNQLLRS